MMTPSKLRIQQRMGVHISPLIDVGFILLAFFIVTTLSVLGGR